MSAKTNEEIVKFFRAASSPANAAGAIFLKLDGTSGVRDQDGRRPVFSDCTTFQTDPHFRDLILFHEYFDGDTGRGLGARPAKPEETANVVVFLAGDGASYLTATTIFADGGIVQSSVGL
jgi:NAD(P)-dependent dehydrogenase (short-subunit alcohol dehydrogenase family)